MVRESLFNILGALVDDRLVIDLFAGTGALGLEALSRGAERAIFVERDRENIAIILRNIATLRYEDRTQVRLADSYRWARSFQPAENRPFVAFLDPPYRETELHAGHLNQLITHLVEIMPAGSAIAIEGGRVLDARVLPEFETWDIRHYGETRLAIKVAPHGRGEENSITRSVMTTEAASDARAGQTPDTEKPTTAWREVQAVARPKDHGDE
jgi:16S rRNA (guanine966-N2)-methyltransferase